MVRLGTVEDAEDVREKKTVRLPIALRNLHYRLRQHHERESITSYPASIFFGCLGHVYLTRFLLYSSPFSSLSLYFLLAHLDFGDGEKAFGSGVCSMECKI